MFTKTPYLYNNELQFMKNVQLSWQNIVFIMIDATKSNESKMLSLLQCYKKFWVISN